MHPFWQSMKIRQEKINAEENKITFSLRKFFYKFLNKISDIELTINTTGSGIFDR